MYIKSQQVRSQEVSGFVPDDFLVLPFSPNGEEGVWVLSVEFEGFADVRPAHRAGREEFVFGVAPLKAKEKEKEKKEKKKRKHCCC